MDALATVDCNCLDSSVLCEPADLICHLHRKFSCRSKYQDLYWATWLDPLQYWQTKGCCLAGSCVRLSHDIFTLQNKRYSCLLYGEWRLKSIFCECFCQLCTQTQFFEGFCHFPFHFCIFFFYIHKSPGRYEKSFFCSNLTNPPYRNFCLALFRQDNDIRHTV